MILAMKILLILTDFLPIKQEALLQILKKITHREKSTIFKSFYLLNQTNYHSIFVSSKSNNIKNKKTNIIHIPPLADDTLHKMAAMPQFKHLKDNTYVSKDLGVPRVRAVGDIDRSSLPFTISNLEQLSTNHKSKGGDKLNSS